MQTEVRRYFILHLASITPLLRTFRATADSAVLAAVVRLEGLSQSGIEPATFCLMAQRLHQLRHRATACPLFQSISGKLGLQEKLEMVSFCSQRSVTPNEHVARCVSKIYN